MTIAGDTLELAVFLSVKMEDEAAFERNYQQLQMYASDARYVQELHACQNHLATQCLVSVDQSHE